MTKPFACVVFLLALGIGCTQQSAEPPAGQAATAAPAPAADGAPAPGAAGQPSTAATQSPNVAAQPSVASAPAAAAAEPPAKPKPVFKEVTIPSGTTLQVALDTAVASDTSKAEDAVRGKLAKAIVVDGTTVVLSGSEIAGTVVEAKASGKVQGLASIAFRFDRLTVRDERHDIRTARFAREARSTKKEDAKKVGIGAGAGALIGAIAGGKKGAAIGTAVGGGAGGGVVLATKGDEVRLDAGTVVSVALQEPVKVLVPID